MNGAFLVNAAILIVAAAAFCGQRHRRSTEHPARPTTCSDSLLGSGWRPIAFALALIGAGQSSTITGTLAGQITMEGFLRFRIRPWLRRLITRCWPSCRPWLVMLMRQDGASGGSVYQLLILSQVVLSLQLPFAVVPLVRFTGSKQKMGPVRQPALGQASWPGWRPRRSSA